MEDRLPAPTPPDDPCQNEKRHSHSRPQIIQEFGCRIHTRHEEMISRPRAGDIEEMAFRIVDLFQVRVVGRISCQY
jgi:hypothetical protein